MYIIKIWSLAMLTQEYGPISEEEYLHLEARSPVRHEYVSGEVFAMTGGTLRHNIVRGNVAVALRACLRNTTFRVFISSVLVRVDCPSAYYYPDISVAGAPNARPIDLDSVTVSDPVLIIEVWSERTEATDRREKLLAYRTLASLAEYALISQDQARVEIHRRRGDIGWEKIEYSGDETVEFSSVKLTIGMRDIYEGVPIESLLRGTGQA